MTRYLIRRSISTVVLLFLIASFVFLLIHVLPGDPASAILGGVEGGAQTPAAVERVREQLGLDRPLHEQYFDSLTGLLQLDLGTSFFSRQPVTTEILNRLPRTLLITVPSVVIAIIVGIPLGVAAARLRNTFIDPLLSAFALLGFSTPVFVTGLILVLIFSLSLGWLPSGGFVHPADDLVGFMKSAALPVFALSLSPMATTMRMTRSSVLEQLGLDYVRTARSKGISEFTTVYRHVLRNAMLPVITVVGLQFGHMFAGSVLIELIFFWPGVSLLLVQSINNRDYPVIQGVILTISAAFVLINLITDLSFALFDPRIRYDR